jgi:hypothetical protein
MAPESEKSQISSPNPRPSSSLSQSRLLSSNPIRWLQHVVGRRERLELVEVVGPGSTRSGRPAVPSMGVSVSSREMSSWRRAPGAGRPYCRSGGGQLEEQHPLLILCRVGGWGCKDKALGDGAGLVCR